MTVLLTTGLTTRKNKKYTSATQRRLIKDITTGNKKALKEYEDIG
jgi:hypothetical protein